MEHFDKLVSSVQNGKKKRKVCLKQNSILKTMLPPYFFLFVWNCLLSILPKFMIHTWNYFILKVSECIVNLYFKYCISRMYFNFFGMRLCISLYFKTPSLPPVQSLWILSPSCPWSKWCLWLGIIPTVLQPSYTQALHIAFSTASLNVSWSVKVSCWLSWFLVSITETSFAPTCTNGILSCQHPLRIV